MDDTISRQATIDAIKTSRFLVDALEKISKLPSAERKGHWIGYAGAIGNKCSECGKWLDVSHGNAEMNYCPNCGAKIMWEGEDDDS